MVYILVHAGSMHSQNSSMSRFEIKFRRVGRERPSMKMI